MDAISKVCKVVAEKYNSVSLILRIALGLVVGAVLDSQTTRSARMSFG